MQDKQSVEAIRTAKHEHTKKKKLGKDFQRGFFNRRYLKGMKWGGDDGNLQKEKLLELHLIKVSKCLLKQL